MHFIRLFSQISYKQINEITLKKETKDMIRFILDEIYSEYVGIFLKVKSLSMI